MSFVKDQISQIEKQLMPPTPGNDAHSRSSSPRASGAADDFGSDISSFDGTDHKHQNCPDLDVLTGNDLNLTSTAVNSTGKKLDDENDDGSFIDYINHLDSPNNRDRNNTGNFLDSICKTMIDDDDNAIDEHKKMNTDDNINANQFSLKIQSNGEETCLADDPINKKNASKTTKGSTHDSIDEFTATTDSTNINLSSIKDDDEKITLDDAKKIKNKSKLTSFSAGDSEENKNCDRRDHYRDNLNNITAKTSGDSFNSKSDFDVAPIMNSHIETAGESRGSEVQVVEKKKYYSGVDLDGPLSCDSISVPLPNISNTNRKNDSLIADHPASVIDLIHEDKELKINSIKDNNISVQKSSDDTIIDLLSDEENNEIPIQRGPQANSFPVQSNLALSSHHPRPNDCIYTDGRPGYPQLAPPPHHHRQHYRPESHVPVQNPHHLQRDHQYPSPLPHQSASGLAYYRSRIADLNTPSRSEVSRYPSQDHQYHVPQSSVAMPNYPLEPLPDHQYFPSHPAFIPTWTYLTPPVMPKMPTGALETRQGYNLSLLSVSEFTVTGVSTYCQPAPSLLGMRIIIKKIARGHGKAVFEKQSSAEKEENETDQHMVNRGRWRIPLGCYHAFFSWLSSNPMNVVDGIPEFQLKIASLGKAQQEKEYPSSKTLIELGVPNGLAQALAPYQRGGVDFVFNREGKALIADEMGLGKTVQAIAAMSIYEMEWPLLVLAPSTARYHWEAEFYHWLGRESPLNIGNEEVKETSDKDNAGKFETLSAKESIKETPKKKSKSSDDYGDSHIERLLARKRMRVQMDNRKRKKPCMVGTKKGMILLNKGDVHVISSGKDKWPAHTRIVICTYSLALTFIEKRIIRPANFRCIIVDESHMLKNPKAKRTSTIIPILKEAKRCLLLSGTPAFAKPMELFPQLSIFDSKKWWRDDTEFAAKYCSGPGKTQPNANKFSELHTLLTSTVMIRRMKADMLKSLPQKIREKIFVKVADKNLREQLAGLMSQLRHSKGVLGEIHRNNLAQAKDSSTAGEAMPDILLNRPEAIDIEERKQSRKNVLTTLFSLTGNVKVPIIVTELKKWLLDPTRGKLCIFAHHLCVLDAITNGAELNNCDGSEKRFIRIDGSTHPKERQESISRFQTDPKVRIAVLGMTAAGVAVTLTAASTVWFAELYWTPAVLLQAEDRCHRIGQQATVKCVYLIGSGTLDEVIWPLIEKKFRDLGEFVEGKMTSIAIHKESGSFGEEFEQSDDEEKKMCPPDSGVDDNSIDLVAEILEEEFAELGVEEASKIMPLDDDDEERGPSKAAAKMVPTGPKIPVGSSETMAICLSDDEEKGVNKAEKQVDIFDINKERPSLRLYKVRFTGPDFGLILCPFKGRTIVFERLPIRTGQLGIDSKPLAGDILVSMNNVTFPLHTAFKNILLTLKTAMRSPPVELVFAEESDFRSFFHKVIYPKVLKFREQQKEHRELRARKNLQRQPSKTYPSSKRIEKSDVIELMDD